MNISEPVVLAKLPKSLHSQANPCFGSSWGLKNGLRRKRQEICVGVAGDSVNVFDIMDGNNLFSHAIPPTTSIEATPVSLRWRDGNGTSRLVCYAAKDQGLRICSVLNAEHDTGPHTVNRLTLQPSHGAVVHMDFVGTDHPSQLLIIQVDGTTTLASANLEVSAVFQLRNRDSAHSTNLIAATCLSGAEARKTILKARTDLANELLDDEVVVSALTLQKPAAGINMANRPFYCTWAVSRSTTTTSPQTRLLMEHDLTSVLKPNPLFNEDLSATFGTRSAMLSVDMKASFTTVDLSGISPLSMSTIGKDDGSDQSALSLSSSHVLFANRQSLQVMDSTYLTTQAVLDLTRAFSRKRKHGGTPVGVLPHLRLVCFFRKLDRILACSNHHIVAFDLKHSSGAGCRLDFPPSLAQSLGRGRFVSENLQEPESDPILSQDDQGDGTSVQSEAWQYKVQQLDLLLKESKNAEFMGLLVQQLQAHIESMSSSLPNITLTLAEAAPSIPEPIIDYVLSKLFVLHPSQNRTQNRTDELGQLSLMRPGGPQRRKLIEILSASGSLSTSRLTRAHWNAYASPAPVTLRPDSISQALSKDDLSALDLMAYARHNGSCDISEQAATVQLLLSRLISRQNEAQKRVTTGQEEEDIDLPDEENAFGLTADNADSTYRTLMGCLTVVLDKLAGAPSDSLSTTFKDMFSEQEVFVLIQILRQSLFQGGYTATLTTRPEEDAGTRSKDKKHAESLKLPSIVALLSACLDVVGPLGVFTEVDQGLSASIVPDLLSEISLATEAIEEAVDLQGLLREALRYSSTTEASTSLESQAPQAKAIEQPRPGDIVTLYTEPDARDVYDGDFVSLPLSLRAKTEVGFVRNRKGGSQHRERSQREMKMLRDRERASYSFERLIL